MSKVHTDKLVKISKHAGELVAAINKRHPDIQHDDSTKMIEMYDALNDVYAPPEVVKALVDDLINCRKVLADLHMKAVAEDPHYECLACGHRRSVIAHVLLRHPQRCPVCHALHHTFQLMINGAPDASS